MPHRRLTLAFLSGSGPRDKVDAIVIYRAAPTYQWPVRGRLRTLKQRLAYVKAMAESQGPIGAKVLSDYQEEGSRRLAGKPELAASSIGGATLPVASVEVTRKTLPALAAQPDVVAILPDQHIRLIGPMQVSYSALARQENRQGLTWGLQELEIPELWETTRGEQVRVAVLDTGGMATIRRSRDGSRSSSSSTRSDAGSRPTGPSTAIGTERMSAGPSAGGRR